MRRHVAAGAIAVLLLMTGACSGSDDTPTPEGPTGSTTSNTPTAGPTAAVSPAETTTGPAESPASEQTTENNTPVNEPEGDVFSFDDAAEFPDGLSIELALTLMDKAKPTDKGAEQTGGDMAVVVVQINNGTPEEFFSDDVVVTATYGDGTQAKPIVDPTGELQRGFSGVIAIDEEARAQLGFAIPVDESKKVTITVDARDEIHDPVSFTGAIEQSAG